MMETSSSVAKVSALSWTPLALSRARRWPSVDAQGLATRQCAGQTAALEKTAKRSISFDVEALSESSHTVLQMLSMEWLRGIHVGQEGVLRGRCA